METTGIILAGGKNTRLGRVKALEKVGGIAIIQRVVNSLEPIVNQILVVQRANQDDLPELPNVSFLTDALPESGPLVGIYTGLRQSNNPANIVVGCDMPFLNTNLLRHMVSLLKNYDAVVPRLPNAMFEPLHSVYSRDCLENIKTRLDKKLLGIAPFIETLKVRFIETEECRRFDPELLSFFNVNRQSELDVAIEIAERLRTNNNTIPRS